MGTTRAVASLIDDRGRWLESWYGTKPAETPRMTALCRHLLAIEEPLIVADAARHPAFRDDPLVTCDDGIRFFAGVPLRLASGHGIGALCVFDSAPRQAPSEQQLVALRDVARIYAELIGSQRARRSGEIAARVVDAAPDAVVCMNEEGVIISWNGAARRMFGRSDSEALGGALDVILPPEQRPWLPRAVGTTVELSACRANGHEFPIELSLIRLDSSTAEGGFAAIIRDISERRAIENDRQNTRALLDSIITNLPPAVMVKDAETHEYLLVNRAAEQLMGQAVDQIVGRTIRDVFPVYGEKYEFRDHQVVAAGMPVTIESAITRRDGSLVQVRTKRIVIDGPDRPGQYILSFADDVTDARRAEAAAELDGLTGLINRGSYIDRLTRLLEAGTPLALLKIDLTRFRSVNDQFGFRVGDEILAQVAARLRLVAGPADVVARVGGNEFVVLLIGSRPADRAQRMAEALVDGLAKPFQIERVTVYIGACVGITTSSDPVGSVDEFRLSAELALRRAKQQGSGGISLFDAEIGAVAKDRQILESDLRDALDAEEIMLAYQPVLSVAAARITGVEALARWTHPVRGPIAPDIFIPLAEECGLIHRLGEQILRRACLDALTWPEHLRVAVNLSPMQFQHGDVYAMVRGVLGETGLDARRLQLEVTENLLIRDVDRTFAELERLRALGIQILMDDFGVGYSSLSYFERFPFDKVKIDKSFIGGIGSHRAAEAIIQAVVRLGRDLDMGIVAEGVETAAQAEFLVDAGCTDLQGYLFSRPVPAAAIAALTMPEGDETVQIARAA